MLAVAVNRAVGTKSEDVDAGIVFLCVLHRGQKRRVFFKTSVVDRVYDPRQVVVDYFSRADREVPDLGISRFPPWELDADGGCLKGCGGKIRPELVKCRGACLHSGVSRSLQRNAEPVENNEEKRFWRWFFRQGDHRNYYTLFLGLRFHFYSSGL